MDFTHQQLPDLYEDVRTGKAVVGFCYIFSDNKGDFMELFIINGETQWNYVIDSFPRQRKYYSTNFPYRSIEDFEHDLDRLRIKLKRK